MGSISNVHQANNARIWILWNSDLLTVQYLNSSDQHINCLVESKDGRLSCTITVIYALNQMEGRRSLWQDILTLKSHINGPWLLAGDFNSILSGEEKLGGAPISDTDTCDFQEFISSSHLKHLKSTCCYFTWCNKQDVDTRIWSRLDRVLVNDDWIHNYTSSQVEFLLLNCSDHSLALLSIDDEEFEGKRPFRFFNMWTNHSDFIPIVKVIWEQDINGYNMYKLFQKLKCLKPVLKNLNKRHFMNISEQVLRAKEELEDTQRQLIDEPFNSNLISKEKACSSKYLCLLNCEVSFYQQKANIKWGLHGDKFSQLFHSLMKNRRHHNRILSLYTDQ
ncbi:uncharacterized protein LOC109829702 [Asparagus officinalis]|uniref:uncharacterized protein LOC109829702 n=1 Tax=Asparagus officinalis TaxID=4686 RepID=UPI00098DF601|nr:uncharacterized protein LOC109829702 [Asparagus officinalis]